MVMVLFTGTEKTKDKQVLEACARVNYKLYIGHVISEMPNRHPSGVWSLVESQVGAAVWDSRVQGTS